MLDLVTRLRSYEPHNIFGYGGAPFREAADEIERLREEIRILLEQHAEMTKIIAHHD